MEYRVAGRAALIACAVAALLAATGCGRKDFGQEAVASVNGETIKVVELREYLGSWAGAASGIPVEQKKQALDQLISGRLLVREARAKGLDNTDTFRSNVKRNEQPVLIAALLRREVTSRLKVTDEDIKERGRKLREEDKTLSEDNASLRARRMVSEEKLRAIEQEVVAAARKEFPATIANDTMERIGKGERVPDDAVLGSVGDRSVTYGAIRKILGSMPAGAHAGEEMSRNPVAVGRALDREVTGLVLAAYAGKQGIAGSEWEKTVRLEMERAVLIDLLAEQDILKGADVSEKEIEAAYAEHAAMFVRDGRKIPLREVRGQIRQFLLNANRNKVVEAYVGELRKKGTVTVKEDLLPKV